MERENLIINILEAVSLVLFGKLSYQEYCNLDIYADADGDNIINVVIRKHLNAENTHLLTIIENDDHTTHMEVSIRRYDIVGTRLYAKIIEALQDKFKFDSITYPN